MHVCVCDMCGRNLMEEEVRYVVSIAVYPAYGPLDDYEADFRDDVDGLVGEIESGNEPPAEEHCREFRFDICSECHRDYIQNPVRAQRRLKARSSDN